MATNVSIKISFYGHEQNAEKKEAVQIICLLVKVAANNVSDFSCIDTE